MILKAIWFSRHEPTEEQVKEIHEIHHATEIIRCNLGSRNIDTVEQLGEVMHALQDLIRDNEAHMVFGVFPTPMLYYARATSTPWNSQCTFYAAWNVQRTIEGQKPTFAHKCFLPIGEWVSHPT